MPSSELCLASIPSFPHFYFLFVLPYNTQRQKSSKKKPVKSGGRPVVIYVNDIGGCKVDVEIVSSPETKFFACTLRPCRKIGSGHFHYENWGMFTYGGQ